MPEQSLFTPDIIAQYLKSQDPTYQQHLRVGAVEMYAKSSPAFKQNFDAPLTITLPIEADTESAYIDHTLLEFAAQQDPPPYRILAHPNYTHKAIHDTTQLAHVQKTIAILTDFQRTHPEVPIGVVESAYPEFAIGTVRKYLADLALKFSAEGDCADILMINHDADLIKLAPHYLRHMYNAALPLEPGHYLTSRVRHAYSHELPNHPYLPNMDKVTAWADLVLRLGDLYYELGVGIRGSDYLKAGGYKPGLLGAATLNLLARIQRINRITEDTHHVVAGSTLVTSPRRLFYKMQRKNPSTQFWETGDMQHSSYRDFDPRQLKDISAHTRNKMIRDIIKDNFSGICCGVAERDFVRGAEGSSAESREKARQIIRVGHTILGTSFVRYS